MILMSGWQMKHQIRVEGTNVISSFFASEVKDG